ncbi:MAG: hypothetical protein U1A27_04970 [Phycisphaerae bacterium]
MSPQTRRETLRAVGAVLLSLTVAAQAQTGFVNWETPHVSPIAITPGGGRLLVVNTADNRLEVFDITGAEPVHTASIPVGLDPVSVRARTNGEAWVINHVSDSISIVDLPSARVVRTVGAGDEPTDVVFAGSPQRAFVSVSQLNQVRVWDPNNITAAPIVVPIDGEDPRGLAVSPDGSRVYAAIFQSGNQTTALRQQDVSNPGGPYGGQNPPPNNGPAFNPPRTPGQPPAPPVGHIVRRNSAGQWLDDNGRNWSTFVTWNLRDPDVAIIDTNTLGVSYTGGMLTTVMAIAVKPDGTVTVVGTEATNEVRFEPILSGVFVRVRMGWFAAATPTSTSIKDLNPHLDYTTNNIPQSQRDESLGDPRSIVWSADGSRGYVTGMGSNNVEVVDGAGVRLDLIQVGQGPTGAVLSSDGAKLYVVNKFAATVSIIDTASDSELNRVSLFDPTPNAIKLGRPFLYDTHATSGLGQVACASCHIDGGTDFLGWDLGNPAGTVKAFNEICRQPTCAPWHPMKGIMVTQSLQSIVGVEPLHWRGDREALASFSPAFVGLQGDDAEPSAGEMQLFEDFIATIKYPPNPNRNLDNTLPTALPVAGGTGNAVQGQVVYNTAPTLGPFPCASCHAPAPGTGTNRTIDFPGGPGGPPQDLKMAQLRGLNEKTGWDRTSITSRRGFGFNHHSEFDTLGALLASPPFVFGGPNPAQGRRDVEALLLSFSGDTHAAVGRQITFDGLNNNDATLVSLVTQILNLVNANAVGLVVHGRQGGIDRGYQYVGANTFQSDRTGETASATALRTGASAGNELTWTVVPIGTQRRIGIDRDADGFFDRDEIENCGDPADPAIVPVARGDVNLDSARNAGDIPAFVNALINPASMTARQMCAADTDRNGSVNGDDIALFTTCLLGGGCP